MQNPPSKPTVAVIIPYYNGANWVERAIKSVVSQSVKADEFIIVNDGSSQEERAALDSLSAKYGFVIIDKENGGQGSARNAGIAACKSEYISLLDQDDFYFPDHIRDLTTLLAENQDPRLGFVYGDLCEADGPGNIVHSNMLRQQPGQHPKQGHIMNLVGTDLYVLPSASLIRRSAFEAVGGFDEQFRGYEDDDLFLRMFRAGYTNYFLDKPVTAWCMHIGSTSWSVKMAQSRWKYFNKLVKLYPDDTYKHLYYFRDCIVPRFKHYFIKEAAQAIKLKSANRDELFDILRAFSAMVSANPHVGKYYKRKLKLILFLLSLPRWMVMVIIKILSLPVLRRLIS